MDTLQLLMDLAYIKASYGFHFTIKNLRLNLNLEAFDRLIFEFYKV